MEKRILYRAYDRNLNEVIGIPFYSHGEGIWKMTHSNGWIPSYGNPDEGESVIYTDIDCNTIGQFTGLRDKRNKMIFERDIIISDNIIPNRFKPYLVFYKDGAFRVKRGTPNQPVYEFSEWCHTKVVGNIDLSPHLLKQEFIY